MRQDPLAVRCANCGEVFEHTDKSRKRLYCSLRCAAQATRRKGKGRGRNTRGKKDLNHDTIVGYLEKLGFQVIDLSSLGGGMPDILCNKAGQSRLAEIKNPETQYGKRGFNLNQQRWNDWWQGEPPAILRTVDDCIEFEKEFSSKVLAVTGRG